MPKYLEIFTHKFSNVEDMQEHLRRDTQNFAKIEKDQGQVAKAINRLIELGLITKKGVQRMPLTNHLRPLSEIF